MLYLLILMYMTEHGQTQSNSNRPILDTIVDLLGSAAAAQRNNNNNNVPPPPSVFRPNQPTFQTLPPETAAGIPAPPDGFPPFPTDRTRVPFVGFSTTIRPFTTTASLVLPRLTTPRLSLIDFLNQNRLNSPNTSTTFPLFAGES